MSELNGATVNVPEPGEFSTTNFFIFDESHGDARHVDKMMLFFHPASVPKAQQHFMMGTVSAMASFISPYVSPDRLHVVSLSKVRMAVFTVSPYTLVLTSDPRDSCSSLRQHIRAIYAAFRFLFGSFDDLYLRCRSNRNEFREAVAYAGNALIPIVEHAHVDLFRSFVSVPHAELPRDCLYTSTLANTLVHEVCRVSSAAVSGAVVFVNAAVMSSTLDITVTRSVLAWLEFRGRRRKASSYTPVGASDDPPDYSKLDISKMPIELEVKPVFLTNAQLAQMPQTAVEDDGQDKVIIGGIPYTVKRPDGRYLGMVMVRLSGMCLAALTPLAALTDENAVLTIQATAIPTMVRIEFELKHRKSEAPPDFVTSRHVSVLQLNSASARNRVNFASHLLSRRATRATMLDTDVEPDVCFQTATRHMHDVFSQADQVMEQLVCDHTGYTWALRSELSDKDKENHRVTGGALYRRPLQTYFQMYYVPDSRSFADIAASIERTAVNTAAARSLPIPRR